LSHASGWCRSVYQFPRLNKVNAAVLTKSL
jgi:hypothetical protein